MAKSNFDAEIKKGMASKAKPKQQQKNDKSSTNDAPGGNPPKSVGTANKQPVAAPAQRGVNPQAAAPVDTMAAMQAAGQAHMDAIHAHIAGLKGGM